MSKKKDRKYFSSEDTKRNDFGYICELARQAIGINISENAYLIGIDVANLSRLETSDLKIPDHVADKQAKLFKEHGYKVDLIRVMADVHNGKVDISNLDVKHRYLVSKLAKSPLNDAELEFLDNLLSDFFGYYERRREAERKSKARYRAKGQK